MDTIRCISRHICGEYICCSLCKDRRCEWRCYCDTSDCGLVDDELTPFDKNSVDVSFQSKIKCDNSTLSINEFLDSINVNIKTKVHNVIADRSVIEKLIKYKRLNKMKTSSLSKKIGVNESTLNKIMRDPASKIRSDSYNKIKEFVKTVNTADKKKLW